MTEFPDDRREYAEAMRDRDEWEREQAERVYAVGLELDRGLELNPGEPW